MWINLQFHNVMIFDIRCFLAQVCSVELCHKSRTEFDLVCFCPILMTM